MSRMLIKRRTHLTDPSGVAQPAVEAAAPVTQYEMWERKAPQPPSVPSTRGFKAPPPSVPSTRGFKAPPPPGPRPTEKAAAAEMSATAAAAAAELSATDAATQGLLDRIERLERGLEAALSWIDFLERFVKPTNVQPLATKPAASAVQSCSAGQLSTTTPPPDRHVTVLQSRVQRPHHRLSVLYSPCPCVSAGTVCPGADDTLERQPSLAPHVRGFSNGGLENDVLEMLVKIKKAVATHICMCGYIYIYIYIYG